MSCPCFACVTLPLCEQLGSVYVCKLVGWWVELGGWGWVVAMGFGSIAIGAALGPGSEGGGGRWAGGGGPGPVRACDWH